MKHYKINKYKHVKSCYVDKTTEIKDWLDQIKSPATKNKESILAARAAGKGDPLYNKTKCSLPCVTYNFLFDKYKNNNNIIGGTGLMYLDIDEPGFDINTIDTSKLFAYYKSFGGIGYAILIQVEGLTKDNFESTYNDILIELGLTQLVDKAAKKATQFNVTSYDEDLYYNPNSYVFSSSISNNKNTPPSHVIIKKKGTYTIDWGVKNNTEWIDDNIEHVVRYDNLDEIPIDGDYEVNWEGWNYITCSIPFKKIKRNKNSYFLSYTNNLLYLNPWLTPQHTLNMLRKVNPIACNMVVPDAQLRRIVTSVFRYFHDGTLTPRYHKKKRKIVFRGDSKLTKDEKLAFVRKELSARWLEVSCQKINDIIDDWDWDTYGKISQAKMYKNHPVSKKTVEKYWHHFKDFVKGLNKDFKLGLTTCDGDSEPGVVDEIIARSEGLELSGILNNFINLDKASFIKEIGRSKSIYDKILELGNEGDISALIKYMDGYWFMDEVKSKFNNYYREQRYSQVA